MTSLIIGTLLGINTAGADIVVRARLPRWHQRHRHHSHCKHRPPVNQNGAWVFVPGHWEYRGPNKKVWIHGHWQLKNHAAHQHHRPNLQR